MISHRSFFSDLSGYAIPVNHHTVNSKTIYKLPYIFCLITLAAVLFTTFALVTPPSGDYSL